MNMRSSSYTITFLHPFRLTGFSDELPAGTYEVLIQEELMGGYGSENYQTKATYMTFSGKGGRAGWMELHAIAESELRDVLSRDQAVTTRNNHSDAALSPQEDLK